MAVVPENSQQINNKLCQKQHRLNENKEDVQGKTETYMNSETQQGNLGKAGKKTSDNTYWTP